MNKIMDVSVTNDAGEAVLFLQHIEAQKLLVTIRNISDQPVQFGEPDGAGEPRPAEHPFDLKILFRPRTLVQPENIKLSKVSLVTTDRSVDDTAFWLSLEDAAKISGNSILDQPAGVVISSAAGVQEFVKLPLARSQPLKLNPLEVLRFELSNINPDVNDGTRMTRVETKFDIRSGVQNSPLRGSTLNQLNLVNVGKQAFEQALQVHALTAVKVGPLAAAFIGSNTVANDGRSLNGLKIRVSINPDFVPAPHEIRLTNNSSIELTVDEWTEKNPFGLVLKSDPSVIAEIRENVANETSGNKQKPIWRQKEGTAIVAVAEGDVKWKDSTLDFNLAVFTSAPSGFARLKIAWSNLSGFEDGELVLLAELGPTFVEEDGFPPRTTALGTISPLRFRGLDATIEMFARGLVEKLPDASSGASRDFSRVVKNSDGTPATTSDVTLRIANSGNGLQIETRQTQITGSLRVDGNVGIGTSAPTTRLQVGAGARGGKVSIFSDDDDFGQLQIGNPNSGDNDEASMCFVTGSTAFGNDPATTVNGHRWVAGNSPFGLTRRFVIGYGNGDSNFGPKLVIRRGGNVGIGTTVPTTQLQVGAGEGGGKISIFSDADDFGQLQIANPKTEGAEASIFFMTGARVLGSNPGAIGHMWIIGNSPFQIEGAFVIGCLDNGNTDPRLVIQPAGNVGIGTSNPEEKLHVIGNIRARGAITPNRDLAENYYSDQDLAAGDVVSIDRDQDRIVMSEQANDDLVLGVISTKPGVLLNSDPDAQPPHPGWLAYPVALSGRVPCKVSDENGPILRGDLLTSSSSPGHAMKALLIDVGGQNIYRQGTIIGKALAPFRSGKGVIDIFICLR